MNDRGGHGSQVAAHVQVSLMGRHGARIETVTADNGTEFHDYKRIEERTKALFYFARPYHSWERGSDETPTGCCANTCRKV